MSQDEQRKQELSLWAKFIEVLNTTSLFRFIKSKTRTEWSNTFKDLISSNYQKLTNSTEKSLVIGFLGGVFAVLFLKTILFLVLLIVAVALLIWVIADEQRVMPGDE